MGEDLGVPNIDRSRGAFVVKAQAEGCCRGLGNSLNAEPTITGLLVLALARAVTVKFMVCTALPNTDRSGTHLEPRCKM